MREEGYYWVKEEQDDDWVIAHFSYFINPNNFQPYGYWSSDYWSGNFEDAELFKINETRILPPQN